jgi:oligopeptidase B
MRPFVLLALAALLAAPASAQTSDPPVATVIPTPLTAPHGHVRTDDYYWLREREDPEVIAYLDAENAYFDEAMAPLGDLRETLFEEIKGRIKQDDVSVPYRLGDHQYYHRYEEGLQYPIHARRAADDEGPEEIILDVNALAAGHDYYSARVTSASVSPDGRFLAFAADTTGRRIYTIHVKNMETGEILPDAISAVTGNLVWANDNRTLFYSKQDPVTLRSDRVFRHTLGTDPAEDVLVYEETDDTFSAYVGKTTSRDFIVIASYQTLASEFRVLDADDPDGDFRVIEPRERDHEYSVDHLDGQFYILTNRDADGGKAENNRLVRAPEATPGAEHWTEVVAHRDDVLLEGTDLFDDYLVLSERKDGLTRLYVQPWDDADAGYLVAFDDPAYVVSTSSNPNPDTAVLRFVYESPTTPTTTYDYDMATRERTLLKQQEILGGFDGDAYQAERLWAPARDGERIPVTVVYRTDRFDKNGSNPLLVYGYGSYGHSIDPGFSATTLSLLDRGFVYATAHVRGSQTLGRRWYENGKLLKKKNTFTDFIDAAEHLRDEGYGDPDRLYAYGGSAGGLLMGAVMNMRPDLFHGLVAAVPFVDVITTMLDDSIPLTTGEYDEWGNPNDPAYYDYILSYSPYDNIEAKDYPNLLVTTGLHDSQVQYWEPAKWVAKLRALKTDQNRLLLHTHMEAGHGGASGRFERYRETARNYAFLLDLAGLADASEPAAD